MRPRSYILLGAVTLVIAGVALAVAFLPRGAPVSSEPAPHASAAQTAPSAPAETPTAATTAAPRAATPAAATPAPAAAEAAIPGKTEKQGPYIRVESPADGSVYHSTVTLIGRVTDPTDSGSARHVDSVTWAISGTDRWGRIPLSTDGSFHVQASTAGLRSDVSIVVRVRLKEGAESEKVVALIDDGKGPDIAIASPGPGSLYPSTVNVEGQVRAPGDSLDALAELASLSWTVTGSDLGGTVRPSKDGSFAFAFSTVGLHGDISLSVHAEDKNGHASSASLKLSDRLSGPPLLLQSPADRPSYAERVTVEGRVGDPADPTGTPAEVKSLSWRMIGRPALSGSVAFKQDGAFQFSFSAEGLIGAQVLELRAEDLNGRATVRTITMTPRETPAAAAAPSGTQGSTQAAAAPQTAARTTLTLSIAAPADNSFYGSSVSVSGTATSASRGDGDAVASVSWSIAGTNLAGTTEVGKNGDFSFTVRAVGLHGTQALSVKAASRGGLVSEKVIVLLDDEQGLPIVIVSPADGGYYHDPFLIEGRVGDAKSAPDLKSLTYEVPGKAGLAGRVVTAADGAFRLPLSFSGISGDVAVGLVAEDMNGHLSRLTLRLHDGTLKPSILLSAPAKGSSYGSLIRVAGRIDDPYAGQPGMEGIESLSWLVSPVEFSRSSTPAKGTATIGPGGAFRFSLPTASMAGAQDLTLTAVAKSGNRAETTLRLAQGSGDVPSFMVAPADRKLTVSWDPVPFAVRYDLTWSSGGDAPEKGRTTTGAVSPLTLSGLENGALYSLRLRVLFDDGGDGASAVAQAIPLSGQTLAPTVKGDYQQIRLSWDRIPGADAYSVWRSLSGTGGYVKIASAVSAGAYVDGAVEFGKEYFYRIAPAGPQAPLSAPASGTSLAFPADKLAHVGSVALSGARRVTVVGGYAFIASGARGVRIVDISTPSAPLPIGELATTDAWSVAVRADYAYVADGESGLRVLDVAAPHAPLLVGTRKTSEARAVALCGDYAYVADGTKGLKVIDISDTRTLARVGALDSKNALDLAVSGNRLFMADGIGGLKIIDISRPAAPALLASLPSSDARGVAVQAGIAVVADGAGGLRVVDVSDAARPALLATLDIGTAAAVALDAGFAYVADGKTGIKVVDLEDPARPSIFTAHDAAGAFGIGVVDRIAYVAGSAGLDLLRVQIQGRSFRVASCDIGGKALSVSVAGSWAYVASHALGLRIVDVSDPSKLSDASVAGSAATRFAEGVAVQDRLAYVADGSAGLRIIDVSPAWDKQPGTGPADVGSYRPGGVVSGVAVSGSTAYIAAGNQGVRVLDVRAPSAPREVATVRTANAMDIALHESWAYVADGDAGVRVLDVSDPAQPKALAAALPGNARSVALTGNLLIVAGSAGVRVVDVSDPRAPVVRGRYDTSYAEDIAASGRYVYIAEGVQGLTVIDIASPSRPVVVSTCPDVFAVSVAVKGDYAIVADSAGLQVVRILIPEWLSR